MLTEKLEKRESQLHLVKTEKKRLQSEKSKVDAELKNAQERLAVAQELDQIDLGQFNSMRQTNLEVAKKIEQFMQATKDKMNAAQATEEDGDSSDEEDEKQ